MHAIEHIAFLLFYRFSLIYNYISEFFKYFSDKYKIINIFYYLYAFINLFYILIELLFISYILMLIYLLIFVKLLIAKHSIH